VNHNIATVVVGRRALLREGIASFLRHTPYKVIAAAAEAGKLNKARLPVGKGLVAIVGVDGTNGKVDDALETVEQLRNLGECKVVLVTQTSTPIDFERVIALAPDGYIHNPESREILLKLLDLSLINQQVFVFSRPVGSKIPERVDRRSHRLARNGGDV
jgi:DNA-binding NarL/FixJ family response regulator